MMIWATIKSNNAGGDDDTLGAFLTGFFLISVYLIIFWIFNYKLIKTKAINAKINWLKLGVIFVFSILPVVFGIVLIID